MRQIFDFVKTTAFGGAIFLLPFAAALLVVVKAGKMAVDSVTPLAEKLPFPKGEAVIAIYVVGALLLALVAFAAGLFARSLSIKKDAASFLEDKVLNKLPPYVALRKYTDHLAGLEAKTNEDLKPVLVRISNGWQLGFLADAFNDGQVAVFMPGAATCRFRGGGDKGAFGAGLLVGWTAHGDRPKFKLVTGVSTGALTAPFAFLGPEYDAAL